MNTLTEAVKILLVEDNPDHVELVVAGLADVPITNTVAYVSDGDVAIDYLFGQGEYAEPNRPPRPDIILLDLRMPKLDGLDVLKLVKDSPELQAIPIVILTTSASPDDLAEAYQRHANSYLVKPVSFQDFHRMLEVFAAYWLGENQLADSLDRLRPPLARPVPVGPPGPY